MPTKNLFNPKNLFKFLSTQHVVVLDTYTLYKLYYFLYYKIYNLYIIIIIFKLVGALIENHK